MRGSEATPSNCSPSRSQVFRQGPSLAVGPLPLLPHETVHGTSVSFHRGRAQLIGQPARTPGSCMGGENTRQAIDGFISFLGSTRNPAAGGRGGPTSGYFSEKPNQGGLGWVRLASERWAPFYTLQSLGQPHRELAGCLCAKRSRGPSSQGSRVSPVYRIDTLSWQSPRG